MQCYSASTVLHVASEYDLFLTRALMYWCHGELEIMGDNIVVMDYKAKAR